MQVRVKEMLVSPGACSKSSLTTTHCVELCHTSMSNLGRLKLISDDLI